MHHGMCRGRALVMLDGIILGVHQQPQAFVGAMRKLRRAGHLSAYISLAVSHGTISISADGGRICRPLVVCHKGRPRLKDEHIAKVHPFLGSRLALLASAPSSRDGNGHEAAVSLLQALQRQTLIAPRT